MLRIYLFTLIGVFCANSSMAGPFGLELGTKLEPQRYQMEVAPGGYVIDRRWVDLTAGEDNLLSVRLESKPSAETADAQPGKVWTEPVTGMEFIWVRGGCYQMGSNEGAPHEKPVHEVCVDGFWMGKTEVTRAQWEKVMGGNQSTWKGSDQYPKDVTWFDAKSYAEKLSSRSGSSSSFRLPTEAEWEYACRSGGRQEKYSGGGDVGSVAWYSKNSGELPHPVGAKQPNGLGLYDMSGNAKEWCEDIYMKDAYSKHARNNPISAIGRPGVPISRVIRGGRWDYFPDSVRCANRGRTNPGRGSRGPRAGFRLLRTK